MRTPVTSCGRLSSTRRRATSSSPRATVRYGTSPPSGRYSGTPPDSFREFCKKFSDICREATTRQTCHEILRSGPGNVGRLPLTVCGFQVDQTALKIIHFLRYLQRLAFKTTKSANLPQLQGMDPPEASSMYTVYTLYNNTGVKYKPTAAVY